MVHSELHQLSSPVVAPTDYPSYEVTVDSANPCRMYRAGDAQSVQRSSDGGQTWSAVFHDAARLTPASQPFTATGLYAPARGAVALSERATGDAVVMSGDAGHRWALADSGLQGVAVRSLTFASDFVPLHAGVAYAVTVSGPLGMAATTDGGQTWAPVNLPAPPSAAVDPSLYDCSLLGCTTRVLVRLDPANPAHLWVLLSVVAKRGSVRSADTAAAEIFESGDGGLTYSDAANFPEEVSQLLVTRTPKHGLRLTVVTPGLQQQLSYSQDDGATFTPVGLPGFEGTPYLAADPADGDRMVVAGHVTTPGASGAIADIAAFSTTDGFGSIKPAVLLQGLASPVPGLLTPLDTTELGASTDPDRVLQVDRDGSFYLAVMETCTSTSCATTTPLPGMWTRQSYWRFRVPSTTGGPLPPTCAACGPAAGGSARLVLEEPLRCVIPPQYSNPQAALAFDGRYLLYVLANESGPGRYQGVIHQMEVNTTGCRDAGTIIVDFRPEDLFALQRDLGCDALPPYIDDMAYDQTRNLLWATLAGPGCGGTSFVFQILITERSSTGGRGRAVLAFYAGCDYGPFTYDFSDDTLWACTHFSAKDGHQIPTCIPDPRATSNQRSGNEGANDIATWVAAPPKLFSWVEDDRTIVEYNPVTCSRDATFSHRQWLEPPEDEQLACDPLTFGPGSPLLAQLGAAVTPGTVLWAHENNQTIAAVPVPPDGICPLPTELHYDGSTQVSIGETATVCAALDQRYPGGTVPLVQSVAFSYAGVTDGRQVVRGGAIGHVVTGGAGAARCLQWPQQLAPGRYKVTATFASTTQYFGSSAVGALRVVAPAVPAATRNPGSIPLPPLPPVTIPLPAQVPQFNPVTTAQGVYQTEVQVQSQSQAQSQSVAQAQPAVMTERQRQLRVVTQTAAASGLHLGGAVNAVGHREARAVAWVGSSAALLSAFALGLMAPQRVRVAWARRKRGVPPHRGV